MINQKVWGLLILLGTFTLNGSSKITSNNQIIIPDGNEIDDDLIKNEEIDDKVDEIIEEKRETVSIYLNPSVQTWNSYYGNLGTEAENMQDIAKLMYNELKTYSYIDVECNSVGSTLSLYDSVKQSNSRQRDLHLALHTNAGGGKGTEIYTYNSIDFANTMYEGFLELGNFNRRGVKTTSSLYEVKNVKAKESALIEFLFHDNEQEASFIVNNKQKIASRMVKAIIDYIDLNY